VVLLSEYGISAVSQPVHINRLLRERGWLVLKEELGRELLDYGASRAFAVADHQVAHIYLNDPVVEGEVRKALEGLPGIERILGNSEATVLGIRHERAGDLIAVAAENCWFSYYYWLEDSRAPDFARTVDIHRKPGYDPAELFLDPAQRFVKGKIAWRLLQKKLGLRMLMDVIPLDASLVRGSHGRTPQNQAEWPVLMTQSPSLVPARPLESTNICDVVMRHVLG